MLLFCSHTSSTASPFSGASRCHGDTSAPASSRGGGGPLSSRDAPETEKERGATPLVSDAPETEKESKSTSSQPHHS